MSIVFPANAYERVKAMKIYEWLEAYSAGACFTLIKAEGGFVALQCSNDKEIYVVNDASDASSPPAGKQVQADRAEDRIK